MLQQQNYVVRWNKMEEIKILALRVENLGHVYIFISTCVHIK